MAYSRNRRTDVRGPAVAEASDFAKASDYAKASTGQVDVTGWRGPDGGILLRRINPPEADKSSLRFDKQKSTVK
jgi:hypothetical protein